jgi:transcriptional regulator with XRE-family HTH domain
MSGGDAVLLQFPEGNDALSELPLVLGRNLRRLRTRQGHSLERLAKLSGVSRAMLGQIETGQSAPTISLLWKISTALGVPFATLLDTQKVHGTAVLRREAAKLLASRDGKFTSRALFPFDGERKVEFYELRIAPGHTEKADAHAPGTVENLVLVRGALEVKAGPDPAHLLAEGDAIIFEADVAHSYSNKSAAEAVAYLVMTYVETVVG